MTPGLARLEALERAATPGEWHACKDDDGGWIVAPGMHEDGASFVATIDGLDDGEANAELIAALRNAAPWLLAQARENERLREERDRFHAALEHAETQRIRESHANTDLARANRGYMVDLRAERVERAQAIAAADWARGRASDLTAEITTLRTRLADVERERDEARDKLVAIVGDWCDECDRPQYVLADGEHACATPQELHDLIADFRQAIEKMATNDKTLTAALENLFALVEEGRLVRDTSADADTPTYLKQSVRLVKVLADAKAALDQARGGS